MKNNTMLIAVFSALAGILIGALFFHSDDKEDINQISISELCTDYQEGATYRCAMHPDFRRKEPGTCAFCAMPLSYDLNRLVNNNREIVVNEEEAKWMQLETRLIEEMVETRQTITCFGQVDYDARYTYRQMARLPGIIEKLYVKEVGEYVRKGQAVATVYSKEIIAALESLKYGKSSVSIVRSAKNNLKSWNISDAQLEQLLAREDFYQPVTIYAEASGLITSIIAKEGDFMANAHMGHMSPLFELALPDQLEIRLNVPEEILSDLKPGMEVSCKAAFQEKSFEARIRRVLPTVNPKTGQGTLLLTFDQKLEYNIVPGTQITASLGLGQDTLNLPVVPKTAVIWAGSASGLYVRKKAGTKGAVFEWRKVGLNPADESHYFIERGLKTGEEIVVKGALRLDGLAQLRGKTSLLNGKEELSQVLKPINQ